MMSSAPFSYSLLQTPADAILSWLGGIVQHGPNYQGIIFCTSGKDADCYLRAAEKVLPSMARRYRNFTGPVAYACNGSDLFLEVLRHPEVDHLSYGATRKFICFDNPAGWSYHSAIISLTKRLSLPSSHIVAVGSHIVWEPPANPPTPVIDYSAITKAVSD